MQFTEPHVITNENDGTTTKTSLTDELFNSRVLTLEDVVTQESVMTLIKSMLVLQNKNSEAPITLLISSPGGSVTAGLALIDVMRGLSCPVNTVAAGTAASMAAVILAAGTHRTAYPHAYVLIHQLMGGSEGQQTDIEIAAQHTAELRCVLDELLAERSNVSAGEVHAMTERDCWCTAERALELGLIDEIL